MIAKTDDYLVINKPSGIPVHPDSKYLTGTLIQKIATKYPEVKKIGEDKNRPGIVHRIDKDASGLLVVARNKKMFIFLKSQFADRKVKKEYLALVRGKMEKDSGTINFSIARSSAGTMAARPLSQEGKNALTEYHVVKYFINYTLVRVTIKTGRTHQIRVHFKALGHPLAGDKLYTIRKQKKETAPPPRLFLHSHLLGFYDSDNQWQEFSSDLPTDLKNYLNTTK
ncbi:MAG: RNA pseudouridine synthase [Patescibacteria group bacterium]